MSGLLWVLASVTAGAGLAIQSRINGELGARLEEATRSLQAQEPEVTITMLNEVTLETPKMG